MSTHRRFHLSASPDGEMARLGGEEANHAFAVFRVRPGDSVALIDGSGVEYAGIVEAASKREVLIRIHSSAAIDREPRLSVTAAVAVPKSAHFDDAVRAACELGLAAFLPLETERSLVRPSAHRIDRWRKIAIEASKQSRRTRVTSILEPRSFRSALSMRCDRRAILTTSAPRAIPLVSALTGDPAPKSALLLVGPEGDFTAEEVAAAVETGFTPALLTASTLRVETALVAAMAAAALGPAS